MKLKITIFLLIAGSGVACSNFPQIGNPRSAIDEPTGQIMRLLENNISELRSPITSEKMRKTGDADRIPLASGFIVAPGGGYYLCDKSSAPNCVSLVIGDELYKYPKVLKKIKEIVESPCTYMPPTPPEPRADDPPRVRINIGIERDRILSAKRYFTCEVNVKKQRDVHFFVMKNMDEIVHPRNPGSLWESNIIEHFIIMTK